MPLENTRIILSVRRRSRTGAALKWPSTVFCRNWLTPLRTIRLRPTWARAGHPVALVRLERPRGACLHRAPPRDSRRHLFSDGKLRDRPRLFLLFFLNSGNDPQSVSAREL